jgi:hypothetical protein
MAPNRHAYLPALESAPSLASLCVSASPRHLCQIPEEVQDVEPGRYDGQCPLNEQSLPLKIQYLAPWTQTRPVDWDR